MSLFFKVVRIARKYIKTMIYLLVVYMVYSYFYSRHDPIVLIDQDQIVVSLTTIPSRLKHELPITLNSLLCQSLNKINIHIFYDQELQEEFNEAINLNPTLFQHQRIHFHPTLDIGPAKKFIPIMKLFKGTQKTLIITDDDHFYSPIHCQTLYENLLKLEGQGVVGFRGWRIQSSMEWGVSILKPSFFGWAEDQFHVIHGWRIRRMYQVGIVTGNEGYAFKEGIIDVTELENYTNAPVEAKMVDDIWLSGHFARHHIKRFVVPIWDLNVDVTRTSAVEMNLVRHKKSRYEANTIMLKYFRQEFTDEGIAYEIQGKNGPIWANSIYLYVVVQLRDKFLEYWIDP